MKKQMINLKFCFKLGKTPKENNVMLVHVHEDQALSMKYVYKWFVHFQEGRESVSDKACSRRPATSISDENIEKVRKLIKKDHRLTLLMIPDELQINYKSLPSI
ncbi:HTH_48 domain-containing protein [Trichonephila clavipes]|uniref:HTH_48 domain-containing protein n=1 Tax=Trichonephila clavipes TaxID=2585209 RepID=A0A8X6SGK5_TRICX|nr:HTH_48 domain-containing protein [Trichonephila clavipes]